MIRTTALVAETEGQGSSLPALIDRAARALSSARTSAEVLEARDLAGFAYDAAKRTARMAQAKGAHDTLIAAAHRAQADALLIESQAKRKLADEYDAAQERGEVHRHGGSNRSDIANANLASVKDIGLRPDIIHEARQIRDAEEQSPGIIERALNAALERGDEPNRAEVKRTVAPRYMADRAAEDEAKTTAILDEQDFKKFRKFWKQLRPGAQRLALAYLKA